MSLPTAGVYNYGCAAAPSYRWRRYLDSIDYAHAAVDLAADKQASNVVLLDVRSIASFTDYFVICTAESPPQIAAIANDASRKLRAIGLRPHHQEGIPESGWVLIDFGDIILHIFSPDRRAYYDLDAAWSAAPQVVHVQ